MYPRLSAIAVIGSVLAASGCGSHVIGRAQGGPTVVAAHDTPYGGAEGNADVLVDLLSAGAADEQTAPPETATRVGVIGGAYVRGTGLGFGTAGRLGAFAGASNADTLLLGSVQAAGGMHTYSGTAYGAVGGTGGFTFGVRVGRTYDAEAALCRSLTYLTFAAQGSVDHLPSAGVTVPGAALLIGVAGLDDGGAPSDRSLRPDARCPR